MSRRDDFKQIAIDTPFDNSSNGFVATNVQTAIEEAKIASSGFDEDRILCDSDFHTLYDSEGNVLLGAT